ncbi:MAG: hypothetical protein K5764_02550 [Prevotella sp.]|nr:hypothetical protein [Prevotella sp.]
MVIGIPHKHWAYAGFFGADVEVQEEPAQFENEYYPYEIRIPHDLFHKRKNNRIFAK